MDKENQAILQSKSQNKTHTDFSQWRHSKTIMLEAAIYFIIPRKWTINQEERARILFELYPDIKTAYILSQQLRAYNNNNDKSIAMLKLAHWYREVWI
jgi:hypothetical protein